MNNIEIALIIILVSAFALLLWGLKMLMDIKKF